MANQTAQTAHQTILQHSASLPAALTEAANTSILPLRASISRQDSQSCTKRQTCRLMRLSFRLHLLRLLRAFPMVGRGKGALCPPVRFAGTANLALCLPPMLSQSQAAIETKTKGNAMQSDLQTQILQHSNPENGTTCYSHAGRIINPFLAAVAIPEQYHADLAAQSCRWQPLGLHTSEQAAHAACLAFIDTLPPEQATEAGYSIMQPGSPLFDRLLARLPQTSR